MERWTYNDGYWQQIDAYVEMVDELIAAGFPVNAVVTEKLDIARSLAMQVLGDSDSASPEDILALNRLIGRCEAMLDTFSPER